MVAHRLSTIKDADLIYVLHKGKIVEAGTHRQLLTRHGKYAALWRAQTEGIPEPRSLLLGNDTARANGRKTAVRNPAPKTDAASAQPGADNKGLDLGDSLYCFSF
jgi:ABC-type multidrug transport system ATPase subunit